MSQPNSQPYHDGDKVHLFLAYFGIFSLIPYLSFRNQTRDAQKAYVHWHASQGLGLVIIAVAFSIGLNIVSIALTAAGLGLVAMVLGLASLVVSLGFLGAMILGWVKAFQGEQFEIPVVSLVAAKLR